jgi:hypothetical protein
MNKNRNKEAHSGRTVNEIKVMQALLTVRKSSERVSAVYDTHG